MNEIELELLRLRMSVIILERLVLKTHVVAVLSAGVTLGEAIQQTLHSIQLDDEVIPALFSVSGLDAAEIGLREAELREIVDRMNAYVLQIEKDIGSS